MLKSKIYKKGCEGLFYAPLFSYLCAFKRRIQEKKGIVVFYLCAFKRRILLAEPSPSFKIFDFNNPRYAYKAGGAFLSFLHSIRRREVFSYAGKAHRGVWYAIYPMRRRDNKLRILLYEPSPHRKQKAFIFSSVKKVPRRF